MALLSRLQEHFESLCDELHVEFAYHDEGIYGESYAMVGSGEHRGFRAACVPAIDSVAAYYVALHELGHTTQPARMPVMTREWDAWTGAAEVALVKATKQTLKRVAYSLTSYASSWESDKRVKRDQRFYDLLAYVIERRNA